MAYSYFKDRTSFSYIVWNYLFPVIVSALPFIAMFVAELLMNIIMILIAIFLVILSINWIVSGNVVLFVIGILLAGAIGSRDFIFDVPYDICMWVSYLIIGATGFVTFYAFSRRETGVGKLLWFLAIASVITYAIVGLLIHVGVVDSNLSILNNILVWCIPTFFIAGLIVDYVLITRRMRLQEVDNYDDY